MSESPKFGSDHVVAHVEDSRLELGKKDLQPAIRQFNEDEKHMSTWQAARAYRRVLLFSLVPFLCGMTYGYDTVASSATMAMPAFLLSFGETDPATGSLYAPSLWSALWTALTNLGQALGSFVMGFVAQRIGRRYAIVSCACISAAGVAVQYTASTRWALLIGKIIVGFAIGGLLALGTTYASDIAPIRLRGPILQALVFSTVAMQGTALGIIRGFVPSVSPSAWKMVFAIQWIVGSLPFLVLLIPESPVWLLSKGRHEEARKSLIQLYGKDNKIDIRFEHLREILAMEDNNHHGESEAGFLECFRGHNLKRTLTVCMMLFGIGMTGVAFLNQNTYFLLTLGLSAVQAFDIGIGGFFLACAVIAASWMFSDRIGRRRLWLVGLAGNVAGMAAVGGLGFVDSRASLWAVAVLMNLLIPWQLVTCTGVAWTIAPEISSYRLRQHTQSLSFLVQAVSNYIFHMVVPYLYNTDSANLGAKTGFVFAGLTACLFVVSWVLVPDTAGLSVDEIDAAYRESVAPRKLRAWVEAR
ncbi:general substrate transporter [Aspergillus germanicus]